MRERSPIETKLDWTPLAGATKPVKGAVDPWGNETILSDGTEWPTVYFFPYSVRRECQNCWKARTCHGYQDCNVCQGRSWVAETDAETWGQACATVNIKILVESLLEDEESDAAQWRVILIDNNTGHIEREENTHPEAAFCTVLERAVVAAGGTLGPLGIR